jgi:hypothetical protein
MERLMKLIHVVALSAGLAGATLFAGPSVAETTTNQTSSLRELGADAKTFYSETDVGEARRAFRTQCTTQKDPGACDCLAAGYAQSLTPPEVNLATSMISQKKAQKTKALKAFSTPEALEAARAHVEEAAAQYEPLCRQPAPG